MNTPAVAATTEHIQIPTPGNPFAPPPLNDGETYIGLIVSADGSRRHHLVLLYGERYNITHADATAWAASIGGELPDRVEGALLFATAKKEFQPEAYWTREPHAAYAGYAWCQYFDDGIQIIRYTGELT